MRLAFPLGSAGVSSASVRMLEGVHMIDELKALRPDHIILVVVDRGSLR